MGKCVRPFSPVPFRQRIGWQAKAPAPQGRKSLRANVEQTLSFVNPSIRESFSRVLTFAVALAQQRQHSERGRDQQDRCRLRNWLHVRTVVEACHQTVAVIDAVKPAIVIAAEVGVAEVYVETDITA